METGVMIKILFVEDERDTIKPVLALVEKEPNMESTVCDFYDATERIESVQPDIVVIDLLLGSGPDPVGLEIRQFVWNSRFCPIVVYSARSDLHDNQLEPHPFVKTEQKGRGTHKKVLQALKEFIPHVEVLKNTQEDVRQSFASVMRDVAPHAFEEDQSRLGETVKRAGLRRVAALMDNLTSDGTGLAAWEQYLWPPISKDLELGDILRCKAGGSSSPKDFRIVLTPSCDMVTVGKRSPKTASILVAKCFNMRNGLERTRLKPRLNKKPGDLPDQLRSGLLTPGSLGGFVPFPRLSGRIPTMMASMRDLELIPFKDVSAGGDARFVRVASISSPFRESLAWAYLQYAARPGLPDRDFDSWAKEITAALGDTSDKGTP